MYYLEPKQFKPGIILAGFMFVPCILGLIIVNILFFRTELLIILLIFFLIYLIDIFFLFRQSKKKNHYLLVKNNEIELFFVDLIDGQIKLELQFDQIIQFEYYRINSIKGWLMLFSYTLPKCVYITYLKDGENITKFIGYLDIKEIKEISQKTKTELKIH